MTNQPSTTGRKPTHRIFLVDGDGDKAKWTEIGAAWPHKDNKGFNIDPSAFPIKGRIVMREVTEKAGEEGAQQ